MTVEFIKELESKLDQLRVDGLFKDERVITSPQNSSISLSENCDVINLCSNNYLGMSNNQALIEVAQASLRNYGFGMSSVRFICGTQDQHKVLEQNISSFLHQEDAILYSSCFDANTGLFETLFDHNDAIISDSLNHASIIDGIRLCKSKVFRYENGDMVDLETQLQMAKDYRYKVVATDGVFSMDGYIANLDKICNLAEKFNAMVMVDDSHGVGVLGKNGKGSIEHCNVIDRVTMVTGTLGKALGGASGGYVAAPKEIINWLRQRSRPYLFSNSLAPVIVQTTLSALKDISSSNNLRSRLFNNTQKFREGLTNLGFEILNGEHPIVPVMLRNPKLAQDFSQKLLEKGIYVVAFSYPVVPKGLDRVRTQISAAHSDEEIDQALTAFAFVGNELGIL
ncbi:MAG: glycine C-acetyltransferase [Paracoccaceae bacterium]|nr:glycine C-acetyltransferase [Paracoccaceae bacterium]